MVWPVMKPLPITMSVASSDVFRFAHAAHGNARLDAPAFKGRAHLGVGRAGRDRVDGDAVLGDARRIAARQALEPGLGGVVDDADGAGAARCDRRKC